MVRKENIGWKVLNITAIFFAALLMLSFCAAFVDPGKFVWLAYLGMLFPFLLTINILYLAFLLANLKITALISAIAIALNWANIQTLAKFKSAEFTPHENKIRVLSYNVNLFDYYKYINAHEGQTEHEILDFIDNETPDILCFQEFRESIKRTSITQFLKQNVDLSYASQSRFNNDIAFGNKIYSRFPILRDSIIRFENSKNHILFADILAYEDTIRLFNFHLESIGFQKTDDQFYQELTTALPSEVAELRKGIKGLLLKMNAAYLKRASQARILAQLIDSSPYQTIVCGDLNDTPQSYAYKQVSKKLNDSFCQRALGFGTSYAGAYPSFRIDYVFFSERFFCENFSTIRVKYSDHFPIISDLEIKK